MTRTSSPLLGVHFWNPARTPGYPVPTLFVEHVYTHPNGDPGRHWLEMADRCRVLRDAGHRVLLKVKFRVGIDQPRTVEELDAYLHGLEALAPSFGGIDVTFGNEPNWRRSAADDPSVSPAWMARVFNGAGTEPGNPWNALQVWRTYAGSRCRYFVTPTGPFAPRGGNPDAEVEQSPWARYSAEFWERCRDAARDVWSRRFQGVALHAYGRTGPDGRAHGGRHEPWRDPRDRLGRRWGSNVLETWSEALRAVGLSRKPVVIAEYNARTDGPSSAAYPPGLLPNAFAYACSVFGRRLEGLAWFVDANGDGNWREEALADGMGRMAEADADFRRVWA